jgi:hypothetical protein
VLSEEWNRNEDKKMLVLNQVASGEVEDLFILKVVRATLVKPCAGGFPHIPIVVLPSSFTIENRGDS